MVMAASIPASVVTPLTSPIQKPLLRRVSNVVKVGEKVKDLEVKMADLNKLFDDIRSEVEGAEQGNQRTPWLQQQLELFNYRVNLMAKEVSDITNSYRQLHGNFGRRSGDVISMYKMGRNATRKLKQATDLYQKLDDEVKKSGSLTKAVVSGQEMPGTSDLIAIEANLDKVLGYLADGVGVVGIHGMGGVGKTALLKSINNSILSRGGNISPNSGVVAADDDAKRVHFDHVIWVTVSRDGAEVQRLQDLIAKQLAMLLISNDKSSRKSRIFDFLRNKRFVLLLDDVWEGLDLAEIGIPDVGRTVVFTTRDEAVCSAMGAEKKVKVEVLRAEDAWRLFQEKAEIEDIESDTEEMEKLARQIAEECGGLPLALVTVGRAMSTKKTSGEWRHALKSLKKSIKLAAANPGAIPAEVIITPLLKFCYDNLIDEKTRQCFLCCALFPEDDGIPKEDLIECLMGHGVINFYYFGRMYEYGDTLIGRLTSACLLESALELEEKECVKMHDIIRNTALRIANDCKTDNSKWIVRAGLRREEPLRKNDNWEWADRISLALNDMRTLPEPKPTLIEYPENLTTLMVRRNCQLERIPESFFGHFPSLTYLDMSRTGIQIFPEEVTMLSQLEYLNLSYTCIRSLSSHLKRLENLRYLILRSCHLLQYIPQDSISKLGSLEVLDLSVSKYVRNIYESGIIFDLSNIHPIDTKAEELKRLKKWRRIKALGLQVKLREFSSLGEFIDLGAIWKLSIYGFPSGSPTRDTLVIGENIQILTLRNCGVLQELTIGNDDENGYFPRLRKLVILDFNSLKKIMWKRPTTLETFPELRMIHIIRCQLLTDLSWIRHVTRLRFLSIEYCKKLRDIIVSDENDKKNLRSEDDSRPPITFSNLTKIYLFGLPRLRNIYRGIIYCPVLKELTVWQCQRLTRLPFNFQSHVPHISAESEWWESVKWDDDNIKCQLEPYFGFQHSVSSNNPLTSLIPETLLRHVSYVVQVGEKVKDLEVEMAELNSLFSDIRSEEEEAEKRGRTQRRNQLLDRVPPMEKEVSDIKIKYDQLGRWCFGRSSGDIISIYKIGRNATRKLAEVKDLYQKLDDEAKKIVSLAQAVPFGREMPGASNLIATEANLEKVLGYVADGVGVVGIHGMGGVGKTALLRSINNSILSRGGNIISNSGVVAAAADDDDEEKRVHFDFVIWVTVSRHGADVQRLQRVIADQLQNLLPYDTRGMGSNIFDFLRNKKFVLLLDDVRERVDLNAIGIPDGGRTVVFTTRDEAVCDEMEAQMKVKVEVLSPEDAWRLFQDKAEIEDVESDTKEMEMLARQIAEECRGLPLALVTVGRAMSTKKTSGEWRHALKSLKKSVKFAAAVPDAKPLLKFFHGDLIDEKTRQCFLCCALFPEGHDIPKEELIQCLMGHGVIDSDKFSDIGGMYDYGNTLIGRLTSACLLESTRELDVEALEAQETLRYKESVKMHDIIRDMALWIANDYCDKDKTSRWIVRAGLGSEEPLKESDEWETANRISLMLNEMTTLPEPKQVGTCPHLSTLMIQRNELLRRIPESFFGRFPALTYLDMSRTGIEIFPEEVTTMVQLQYLNLSHTDIESLSSSLKNLVKLRYLILCHCNRLRYIPEGSISSLPSLQVLDLSGSGITFQLSTHPPYRREVEEELKRLKGRRIKALGLDGRFQEFSSIHECVNCTTIWKLSAIALWNDSPVRDMLMLGKNIQMLQLDQFSSLQELTITSDSQDGHFPRLRELRLRGLNRLEKIIWKRPTTFPQLTTIHISSCHVMDMSWIRHVTCLEVLWIHECIELRDIIVSDENDQKGHRTEDDCRPPITFSNLRNIILVNLPRLSSIYQGTIYCPLLQELCVRRCEGLRRLPFNFQSYIPEDGSFRILGVEKWWESVEWEDGNVKSDLERFFFSLDQVAEVEAFNVVSSTKYLDDLVLSPT